MIKSEFVQCDDDKFYLNPRWNNEVAYIHHNKMYVKGPRSVGGARKAGRSFLKKRQIVAKIETCHPEQVILFPGATTVKEGYVMEVNFLAAPPKPDEWETVVSSVSIDDTDFAFKYPFKVRTIWEALNEKDIDAYLGSFVMGKRLFPMDIPENTRKILNRLKKLFPDMVGKSFFDTVTIYGTTTHVSKG